MFVNVFFKEMDDTTTPVRSIATGDIQSPETSIIDFKNWGTGILKSLMIMPISMAINKGLKKDLRLSLKVCFFSASARRSFGTPQRYIRIQRGSVKIKYSKKISGKRLLTTAFPMNPKFEKHNP